MRQNAERTPLWLGNCKARNSAMLMHFSKSKVICCWSVIHKNCENINVVEKTNHNIIMNSHQWLFV
jgi:hypothetical protein